jgi:hypothetical protein
VDVRTEREPKARSSVTMMTWIRAGVAAGSCGRCGGRPDFEESQPSGGAVRCLYPFGATCELGPGASRARRVGKDLGVPCAQPPVPEPSSTTTGVALLTTAVKPRCASYRTSSSGSRPRHDRHTETDEPKLHNLRGRDRRGHEERRPTPHGIRKLRLLFSHAPWRRRTGQTHAHGCDTCAQTVATVAHGFERYGGSSG